jgi:hypothetical protein
VSEDDQSIASPCGRWYISVETEHCLGDSQSWFKIYDKRNKFKSLVTLYEFPREGIYFDTEYNHLFLEKNGEPYGIIDIATGKSLTESNGHWYKEGEDHEQEGGFKWPRDKSGLISLDDLLKNVSVKSSTF